mgnify:CR=1 FL=1
MKHKVGDKVKIVDCWNEYTKENNEGLMDKYLGTVMTIDRVLPMGEYKMIEDEGIWFWNEHCIDGVVKDVEFEEKFQIYDTVRHPEYGLGTVIEIENHDEISVDFDEYNPNLHTLNRRCLDGHGWYCHKSELRKVG